MPAAITHHGLELDTDQASHSRLPLAKITHTSTLKTMSGHTSTLTMVSTLSSLLLVLLLSSLSELVIPYLSNNSYVSVLVGMLCVD